MPRYLVKVSKSGADYVKLPKGYPAASVRRVLGVKGMKGYKLVTAPNYKAAINKLMPKGKKLGRTLPAGSGSLIADSFFNERGVL